MRKKIMFRWAVLAMTAGLLSAIFACASTKGAEHIKTEALDIKPELTRAESYTIKLFFENTGDSVCEIDAYEMRWEGGEKRVEPRPTFSIAPKKKEYQVVTIEPVRDSSTLQRGLSVRVFCREG